MIISKADRLGDVKTYYFVQKLEQIRQMREEGKDVINFGVGSPDLPPSAEAIKAMSATANREDTHGYQSYKGIPELRAGISAFYKHMYGVSLSPENEILPLIGSKEGILHLTLAFVNPGDEVLVPNPGYPTYTSLTKLLGGKVRHYHLKAENNWYPDFDELARLVTPRTKIMWLNYPHMPTGKPASKAVFEKMVAFAKKHHILLCHDNPYSLVLNKQQPISLLSVKGAKDVAVELNSFSKSHNMAGWRLGMMLGAESYITAALKVKSNIDSGMFLGTQRAAVEALKLDDQWHAERNKIYHTRREGIFRILDILGFTYTTDQEGLFVWARPAAGSGITDITEFVDKLLLDKHLFFTPGKIFGSEGEGFMRASLCVPEERIQEALSRL